MKTFLLTFGAFVGGAVLVKIVQVIKRRRDARLYPNELTRYAESKVQDSGHKRNWLGRI
jgi:hypothetical protein